MNDAFHKFTNWLSYNRWTALGVLIGAMLVGVASCEFKAPDPVTGKPATATQIENRRQQVLDTLKAEQDKAAKDYAVQVEVIRSAAATQLAEAAAKFDASTAQRIADAKVINANADDGLATIAKKQEIASGFFTWTQNTLAAVNPQLGTALAGLFGLATVGLGLDNRRKDRVIAANATPVAPPAA